MQPVVGAVRPAAGEAPPAPGAVRPAAGVFWLSAAVWMLWTAAWVELIFNRLLSRAGVFIPKTPALLAGYRVLSDTGLIALNVVFFLCIVLAVLGVIELWQTGRRGAAAAVTSATVLILLPSIGIVGRLFNLFTVVLLPIMAMILSAPLLRANRAWGVPMAVAAALAVHLTWYGAGFIQTGLGILGWGGSWSGAAELLKIGELLALCIPLLLTVSFRPAGWRVAPWLWAAVSMALLTSAYMANKDLLGVMAIWSLGFTLAWPAFLYVASLGAAAWWLAQSAVSRNLRMGFGLIFLAGFGLQMNLQHLLVLVGYLLLSGALELADGAAPTGAWC